MTRRAFLAVVVMAGAAVAAAVAGHRRAAPPGARPLPTLTLTAVMAQGVWTDEDVTAANAWRRDFRVARPILRRGRTVRLRLASADVVHTFSVPDLGVDPVEVHPGRVAEIVVSPDRTGTFEYYCTTVCGVLHVVDEGAALEAGPLRPGGRYWQEPAPPAGAGRLAVGAALFRRSGCVTCHGEEGRGGVANPNSMNAVVPELATLARRTFLFAPAEVSAFRHLLESGGALEGVQAAHEIPLLPTVRTQYLTYRQLVREGRRSAKLEPLGPRPPLDMPAWGARLTDQQIDSILSYLLSRPEVEGRSTPQPHSSIAEGDVQ